MERKCENCVFRAPKPTHMNFLPNDFICGSFHSKWHGYWPINGSCDNFREPTGKTIEEYIKDNEQAKKVIDGMLAMMGGIWNKDFVDGFMKQDEAVLRDYGVNI